MIKVNYDKLTGKVIAFGKDIAPYIEQNIATTHKSLDSYINDAGHHTEEKSVLNNKSDYVK